MSLPLAIDSSMVATFRACPQKWFREYVQHYQPQGSNVDLHAGGAYASALEEARRAYYEQGKSKEDAEALGMHTLITKYGNFECPERSPKTLSRMMGALEFYFSEYSFDSDSAQPIFLPEGKRGIEFTFAIPLPILHPDTGNPILYCGRTDMLVDFAGGKYILDDKTTTSLGPQWAKKWTLRSQFSGYCWATQQIGIEAQGVIVRGLGILKTQYTTQQVITPRSQFLIDRWFQQTLKDISKMVHMYVRWKETQDISVFDFSLDESCNNFGGCTFVRVCESPQPEAWLEGYFKKEEWQPLTRTTKNED